MRKTFIAVMAMVTMFWFTTPTHATLIDRGGGLIYDDDRNITWLQDAGLGGPRNWDDAMAWANALVYQGYIDWRLPSALDVGGGGPTWAGGTSEFTTLFAYGIRVPAPALNDPVGNPGPFLNLPALWGYYDQVSYWTSTEAGVSDAWSYNFAGPGYWANILGSKDRGASIYAWAVRPGDSAPVPEPATMLLLGSGLAGIALLKRRLRK